MPTPAFIPPVITATAPIRICDLGGWTDTWFARTGAVFNIAVTPVVEVQIQVQARAAGAERVEIAAENYGERYHVDLAHPPGRHPLVEAVLDLVGVPEHLGLHVNLYSDAPPGASTGTSAALSVALIGALAALTRGQLSPYEVARLAHAAETEKLGLQSGIQDQLASAYGGLNLIQMHAYPHASVSPVRLNPAAWWELEARLATVYIGRPHSSSEVHQAVIASLGVDAHADPRLQRLRELAVEAVPAVYAGDFAQLGRLMGENTAVQRALHPGLVGEKFEEAIALAREFGVLGAKVNGAGGDGGSITLLTNGDRAAQRRMLKALVEQGYPALPTTLSAEGLRVW